MSSFQYILSFGYLIMSYTERRIILLYKFTPSKMILEISVVRQKEPNSLK